MENLNDIPDLVRSVPLDGILRIDVGLEGDWNPTIATVWSREAGFMDFSGVIESHPTYKSSLELYFQGVWRGIHCFNRTNNENVFDKDFVSQIIDYIDSKLR